MKTPRDLSRLNICAKYLHGYYEGWLAKLIINLIVVAPPALIATLYSNKDLKNFILIITSEATYSSIAAFGRDHVLLFNAIAFIWPVVLLTVGSEISKRAKSSGLDVENLLALVKSLDSIVGIKNKRFYQHTKKLELLTKEKAFETITDPNAQIAEIVKEIGVFFNAVGEKRRALIRVTLAVMINGRIDSLPIFYPNDEPITSSLDSLNSPNSAFQTAFKTKKILLISDIKKELKKSKGQRKFAETENEEDNSGSMICFPVKVFDSSIPFVISIHSDEPGHFKDEFKEVYEHTLQRFALRLSVENSLLIMKETLCGK